MRTLIAVAAIVFCSETALGHPGHGLETGFSHFLASPFHIGIGLGVALAVFSLWRVRRQARQRL